MSATGGSTILRIVRGWPTAVMRYGIASRGIVRIAVLHATSSAAARSKLTSAPGNVVALATGGASATGMALATEAVSGTGVALATGAVPVVAPELPHGAAARHDRRLPPIVHPSQTAAGPAALAMRGVDARLWA